MSNSSKQASHSMTTGTDATMIGPLDGERVLIEFKGDRAHAEPAEDGPLTAAEQQLAEIVARIARRAASVHVPAGASALADIASINEDPHP